MSDDSHSRSAPSHPRSLRAAHRRFTLWRRLRPWWGGIFTILGAVELLSLTASPVQVMMVRGLAGIGTLVITAMLVALAVISWAQPQLRSISGVFIVILALASFAVSNLGGFFLGMLFTMIGGALIFAWEPGASGEADPAAPSPPGGEGAADDRSTMVDPQSSPSDGPRTKPPEADTVPRNGIVRSLGPRSRWRHLAGIVAVIALIAASAVSMPTETARAATAKPVADPTWPWPWPSWPDEPTVEPDEPQPEPDKPEPDDYDVDDSDGECDRGNLPTAMPKPGSAAAESAALALADCLTHLEAGDTKPRSIDLPPASADHAELAASSLDMFGLEYGGVVNVPTVDGSEPALEFTMDSMQIADMDQASNVHGIAQLHVINEGAVAELTGNVRLYVTSIAGKLFGLVPVVFTPEAPPPLIVPYLNVTDVTTTTALVRCEEIRLPNLSEPTR